VTQRKLCVRDFGLFASDTDTKIDRFTPSVHFGRGLPQQPDVFFFFATFVVGKHNLHRLEKIEQPLKTKAGRAIGFILLVVVVVLRQVREHRRYIVSRIIELYFIYPSLNLNLNVVSL
jgi:hypothetical protein